MSRLFLSKGSGSGTPLADLVHGMALSRGLCSLGNSLSHDPCCIREVFLAYDTAPTSLLTPGKSEAVMRFLGPESRVARAQLAANSMQLTSAQILT